MKLTVRKILFVLLILFAIQSQLARAQSGEKQFSASNTTLGLLEAKLIIDENIDQTLDVENVRSEISQLARDITSLLPKEANELDKVLALRKYLYDSGEWNNNNPFVYDLSDPFGRSETSRLLHNYLETRKGNCVSMPILHAILGQRLGLNMTLSTAPEHVFVKFTTNQGHTINIEATSGGNPTRDDWYKQHMPMTKDALKNGMYMKPLTNEEAYAVMGHDLVRHLIKYGDPKQAIETSELYLTMYPEHPQLLISHGQAYEKYVEVNFYEKYPTKDDLTPELMQEFQILMGKALTSYQKVEELGWRHPDDFKDGKFVPPPPPVQNSQKKRKPIIKRDRPLTSEDFK